jgi:hypothetical protein
MSPHKSLAILVAAIALGGCGSRSDEVWIDLDRVVDADRPAPFALPTPPSPPKGSPARSFTLPGRNPELVNGPSLASEARTVRQVEVSQTAALDRLRKKLQTIYARQADLYAEEQARLLGDPDQKQFEAILPRFRAAFEAYAATRQPVYIQLIGLAGFPDSNPRSEPPPPSLSPLAKARWIEANEVRTKLKSLDQGYSATAAGLVAEAGRSANADRLALVKKISRFREEMNDKAIAEASNPLQGETASVVLSLPSRPAVVLPPEPARRVTLPAVPPAASLPKVDSQEASVGPAERRGLIERQLAIWLALNRKVLASGPGKRVPDQTQDFIQWRDRQQVGP